MSFKHVKAKSINFLENNKISWRNAGEALYNHIGKTVAALKSGPVHRP